MPSTEIQLLNTADHWKNIRNWRNGLNLTVSTTRKVHHAAMDWLRSQTILNTGVANAIDAPTQAAALGQVGVGFAVEVGGISATAAAAVIILGAWVTAAIFVLGILGIAYSLHTRREHLHSTLAAHTWSLVNAERPSEPEDFQALGATAIALLIDADKQSSVQKLKHVEVKLELEKYCDAAKSFARDLLEAQKETHGNFRNVDHFKRTLRWRDEQFAATFKLLTYEAYQPGGAIFEYTRRLCHLSNYLTAGAIYSAAVRSTLGLGSRPIKEFYKTDFFNGCRVADECRSNVNDLGKLLEVVEQAYNDYINWRGLKLRIPRIKQKRD